MLEDGEELVHALDEFARGQEIAAAEFTGVGSFAELTLSSGAHEQRLGVEGDETLEVRSIDGRIAAEGDGPHVHAYAVVDASSRGRRAGAVVSGRVHPAVKLVLTER